MAVDFVAPESMGEASRLAQELRQIGKARSDIHPEERYGMDKLQGMAMMLHSVWEALEVIKKAEERQNEGN